MASILKILGDWKGAKEALNAVEKHAKKVSGNIRNTFRKIGSVFNVANLFGAGIGGVGVVKVLSSLASRLDEIGKSSRNLEVTTEYFQKMKYAAIQTRTEFTRVQNAFSRVQTRVAKLMDGDATSVNLFAMMGLGKDDLAGLNAEQVFNKVNRSIASIGDEQKRNLVQNELYGESFQRLNDFLKNYVSLGDDAKSRGLIIKESAIKAAEDLSTAMTNAGTAFMAALAGSGAVEFINEIAQMIDAAASMDRKKREAGVISRRDAISEAIDTARKSGKYSEKQFQEMKMASDAYAMGFEPHNSRKRSAHADIDRALREIGFNSIANGAAGTTIMGRPEFKAALAEAMKSIPDLSYDEGRNLGGATSIEDIEARKNKILAARAEELRAKEAEEQKRNARAGARMILGTMTTGELGQIDEAQTAEAIYAAVDKITAAREEQAALSEKRLEQLDRELKYQRMINDGKAKEVEIEKALQREADARGVTIDQLPSEIADRIRNAVGQTYDLRNPEKSAQITQSVDTPSDALRRIGGNSGAFNSTNSALNYARRSADNLDSIKTDISSLNNKVTSSDGSLRAP